MSQTLFVFSSVFIPIFLVVSFFIWLNSLIEGEIPFSKKKCVNCGKKDKKKYMKGHVFGISMQVIYFCPECDMDRGKSQKELNQEYVESERGI